MINLHLSVYLSVFLLAAGAFIPPASAQDGRNPFGPSLPAPQPGVPPGPVTPPTVPEAPSEIIARALAAHGTQWKTGEIRDWVSEGTLTYFTVSGAEVAFNVTLLRKGDLQVQRTIMQAGITVREGWNGTQMWHSAGGFSSAATGDALHFIESQTVRSIQNLFKFQGSGLALRNAGTAGDAQLLEAQDANGRKTTYSVDVKTSLITRVEFVIGQSRDPFSGGMVSDTEAYLFSDFRTIQGLATPFKIERYIRGFKAEEMRFTSVSYNASLKDDAFHP